MSWFTRKDKNIKDSTKKELPSDLWTKCNCGEILYSPELESANFICHHCSFHFPISSEKYINIILDDKEFLPIEISIKKDHNGNSISQENLINPLNVLKNLCQFSFKDKKIIHMLIENYQIDGKDYSFLPENLKCNNFSLDIKFICLSKNLIEHYESVLKRYHILVNQILNAKYIEQFQDQQNPNIYTTASRIISGYNNNEISLINKTFKSKGFFEKFFDLFG